MADDLPAFNRALAAAVQHGSRAVLFVPAGKYCLGERTLAAPGLPGGDMLHIDGADGLTVQGEAGTRIICRDLLQSTLAVQQSKHVILRNLEFDTDPLPYTQGSVVTCNATEGTVELQVDKDYDDIDRPDLREATSFRVYDSPYIVGWKEDRYFPQLTNRVRLGPGHWRLAPDPAAFAPRPGEQSAPSITDLAGKKWILWAQGVQRLDDPGHAQ